MQTPPGESALQATQAPAYGRVTVGPTSGQAWAKLATFLLIILAFGTTSTVLVTKYFSQIAYRLQRGVLYSATFKDTNWQSFGTVPEAELVLPIEAPNGAAEEYPFLLDTGAVVSSLPREMADKLGFNLAMLPRQTFKGFGNTTSFAYQADMTITLGDKKIQLPVVFTEAGGSRALLGRKGLFDKYTILLDHNQRVVEIRE